MSSSSCSEEPATPAPAGRLGVAICAGFLGVLAFTSCILVRGRQGDRILFPLEPHADLIENCEACHDEIATDDVTSDTRRALERRCLECHSDRTHDCSYCHTSPSQAGILPDKERHLSFSHQTHLVRTFGDCSVCHPGPHGTTADPLALAHTTQIPAHDQCFSCHEMQGFYDRLECQNCHESMFKYGLKPYDQFAHTADWLDREHGDFVNATSNVETCVQCHERDFCSDCHFDQPPMRLWERSPEKLNRQFIHAGDFIHRHMWEVRASGASCMRCHSQQWCQACHDSRGVSQRGAALRDDGFQFHGPGVLDPLDPEFHGTAARRDILSCAACHTEGMSGNCVDCHRIFDPVVFGGNPHPPGFKSRLSRTGAPVCRLCHVR